jgi:hypothetical protein
MQINLWSGWDTFTGAIVSTALVYLFTIVAVRLTGRRALSLRSAATTWW